MSSVNFYDHVIWTFTHGLETYAHLLARAQEHAESSGQDADAALPGVRLVASMKPLSFQVHNAARHVHWAVYRLAGAPDTPLPEHEETTFADMVARVKTARDLVATLKRSDSDANEAKDVTVPVPWDAENASVPMTAKEAVLKQNIPNFYFHLAMGYAILRSQAVPLGKGDYLASFIGVAAGRI